MGMLGMLAPAMSQTGRITSVSEMMTYLNADMDYLQKQKERYSRIEGTPYVDEEFRKGSLYFSRTLFTNLELRYNVYEGYFEFKSDDGFKYIDPRRTPVDTVWLNGDTYLYITFQSGKQMRQKFMKLISDSGTRVLLNHRVVLSQPEAAKGYEEAKPARFEKLADAVFIQHPGNSAREFKGKKSMMQLFPEHHKQLSEFVKSEKLKLKKTGDIVRLVAYYDSL